MKKMFLPSVSLVFLLCVTMFTYFLTTPFLPVSAATPDDYVAAFQTESSTSVWPVKNSSQSMIEQTFGPRIKPSTNSYDWHRGIDIDAQLGTPVVAAKNGVLWKVTVYPDGGNTVILRHTFPTPVHYLGKTLPYYFTFYMHLDSINPTLQKASDSGLHPTVKAGDAIGTVGHSGSGASADHLHFEMRIGTMCTLEYQLQYPNSSCSVGFGFDPAMHPLFLYGNFDAHTKISIATKPTNSTNGVISLSTDENRPILNRYTLSITSKTTGSAVANMILDLNQRTGFDAKTTKALDTQNTSLPYLSPLVFSEKISPYGMQYIIPTTIASKYPNTSYKYSLTITDIWGRNSNIVW